jgi:hypothetical protein
LAHEPAPLALATSSPKPTYPSTYSSSLHKKARCGFTASYTGRRDP